MTEHESDILIVDRETETIDTNQNDSSDLFEYDNTSNQKSIFEFDFTKKSEPSKTVQKEADAFVNYKSNNLNKVYKKYDIVQTYVPKKQAKQRQKSDFEKFVTEQDGFSTEKETVMVEKTEQKPKYRLKPKAKAWLVACIVIFAMLGGLSIYNAVHISNMNSQITETTVSINNVNNDIKKVVSNIDELTDEDNILKNAQELGLKEVTEENKVNISLNEKNQVTDYESQTNFFDKICNFFRNLFGG